MIIESDGNGGWFLYGIDSLNASVHLTVEWCDEYERHQIRPYGKNNPGFNRLKFLVGSGNADPATVRSAFADMQTSRTVMPKPKKRDTTQLHEWNKERRAKNR